MNLSHPGPYATVTPFGREAERCTACHEFSELSTISSFVPLNLQSPVTQEAAEPDNPLKVSGSHPGGWLAWHDYNIVGCVGCHGGQPAGTSYSSAGHELMFDNVDLVNGAPSNAAREASCGHCHEGTLLPGAPLLSRGRALIQEHNCSACHELPGWLAGSKRGPDLGRVGEKYSAGMLALLPDHVHEFKPGSAMPQFSLPPKEAADIAVFLAAGRVPSVPQTALSPVAIDDPQALTVLARARCVNCHVLPALPAELSMADLPADIARLWQSPQGSIGPSLAHVGRRLSAEWIASFLVDTHAWNPGTRMPRFELDEGERLLLAGWLHAASRGGGPDLTVLPDVSEGYAVEGKSLFMSRGCSACHSVNGQVLKTATVGPSLVGIGEKMTEQWQLKAPEAGSLFAYLLGNLEDPASVGNPRMPHFAIDDEQILAIVTALLGEPAAATVRQPALRESQALQLEPLKSDWQAYWVYPVTPQGSGNPELAIYERDPNPESCRICHREQYADWLGTRHSKAMGPGILGQIVDMDAAGYSSCLKCHAVLSEQLHVRKVNGEWQDNPDYREELYLTGVSCASCHLRAHKRFAAQKTYQQYPWSSDDLSAHPLERSALLGSSDFCWNCHQFDESRSIADGNPPLQNTNIEHRDWQQATGDTRGCQDCHMPGGRHTFEGIHSEQFVRDALDIKAELMTQETGNTARLKVTTRDVGHYFPTYVTPAVFVEAVLLDASGTELAGSLQVIKIHRDARTRSGSDGRSEWYDEEDSRIPPASSRDFDFRLDPAAYAAAQSVRLTLRVEPDFFYHNAYARWLKDPKRSSAGLELLRQAHAETGQAQSGYLLFSEELELP
jgi:mono/diheme cytochrome c family protein